ncbi:MAG: glycosyltransferase [Candidatus Methanoperedens sp.]|nr:glycosyltransferase [Candidatus Methanoperedens sp.]
MGSKNIELSVIIPAYNEKGKILTTIKHVIGLFNELGIGHEIIVVDDGSTDGTFEEATSEKFDNIKVVGLKENRGKGYAIKYGTSFVTKDVVTFLDADIVVGSKRHPLSNIEYYPLARRFFSRMYNIVLRALLQLNIRDTQAGFKLIKKEAIQKIFPQMRVKRYAFDVEFLAYANLYNYKIVEAPIILKFTRKGWGRINFKTILNIFLDTVAIASRFGVLRYYARVFRNSAIMVTAFVGGMFLYKQFVDPHFLPEIEIRGLTAIFVFALILIVVTLPYESIARKFEKEN